MHLVTGGTGFIGSHVVRGLNEQGIDKILVVDNLSNQAKMRNLEGCKFADCMDLTALRVMLEAGKLPQGTRAILHQGACAVTTETDREYMLDNNFTYSKLLLDCALQQEIPFIYASSASVYGINENSAPVPENENPLNVYAESKLLFDQHLRHLLPKITSTVAGLRYFNVYGPQEEHKGPMASMVTQLYYQLKDSGKARLFEGTDGYANGEQRRDFLFVKDAVKVNLFFLDNPASQGIYNLGTGKSRSFNDIANTLIQNLGQGEIEYVPFPAYLVGKYQSFTEADLSGLRAAGYTEEFTTLEDGIGQALAGWHQ
ncbi:MAG: ADP-glyceromanno-heptose 6-epimerase [Planctomycetes bacterium]|nr:ADP-glyceromanno-heptose 6-epimerase [Planctomycetota bacterium]